MDFIYLKWYSIYRNVERRNNNKKINDTSLKYARKLPNRIVKKDTDDLKEKINTRIAKIKTGKAKFYSVEEAREKLAKRKVKENE